MGKIDNKLNGARNLGILGNTALKQADNFKPKDPETLYRFGLDKSSRFDLALSGLAKKTNADVELYRLKRPANDVISVMGNLDFRFVSAATRDANLQLMAASKRKGNKNENIALSSLESGDYVIRVLGRSGKSRYGLGVVATAIGSLEPNKTEPVKNIGSIITDTVAPTATLNAANLSTGDSSTYDFTVTYTDNKAVNVASFDNNDVQVTGPNGFNQLATFLSVNDSSNGNPRTVTYRITAPGGSWDNTDNGSYSVALQGSQVSDTSDNFASAASLGSFLANIPLPRRVIQYSGGSNGPLRTYWLGLNVLEPYDPQSKRFDHPVESFEFLYATSDTKTPLVAQPIQFEASYLSGKVYDQKNSPFANSFASRSGVIYTTAITTKEKTVKLLSGETITMKGELVFLEETGDPVALLNASNQLEQLFDSKPPMALRLSIDPGSGFDIFGELG